MKPPPPSTPPRQSIRGWGGALGRRRAFACVLVRAVLALALLCLFYGAAFGPTLRRRHRHPRAPLRPVPQAQAPVPADLALSSLPVRTPSLFPLVLTVGWSARFAD
jgi:hypothetical protein